MSWTTAGPFLQVVSHTHLALTQGIGYRGARDRWDIPAGFRTDLASVPQVFQWLVDDRGAHTLAAVLHDWLCYLIREHRAGRIVPGHPGYGQPVPTQSEADGVFRRVMREEDVDLPTRWLAWAAVRLGQGMRDATARDWWHLAAVLPGGLLVAALTLPPALGRLVLRLAVWVTRS